MQQQLREKLERLHELAGIVWEGDGGEEVSAELAEMRDLTALMLAEPDMNCDRFLRGDEAFSWWRKNVSTCDDNKVENEAFNRWLFADRKGETNGRK